MVTSPEYEARDEWLLHELKAATADLATVPAGAREAARATFTWRLIDEELETLTLCFDSAVDEVALVRGPSTSRPRTLSFECEEFGVEIEVHAGRVTGQLLPPQPGAVRLLTAQGAFAQTTAGPTGCFVFDRPASGPLRLECDIGGPILATEWVPF